MITKTGSEMVKEAILGATIGAVRANNLTAEQRRALEQEYGLDEGASLGWRNTGRGWLGSALGAIPGRIAVQLGAPKLDQERIAKHLASGGSLEKLLANPPVTKGNKLLMGLGMAGALAGSLAGAKWMTDKYSAGNAERVMAKNRKPEALPEV